MCTTFIGVHLTTVSTERKFTLGTGLSALISDSQANYYEMQHPSHQVGQNWTNFCFEIPQEAKVQNFHAACMEVNRNLWILRYSISRERFWSSVAIFWNFKMRLTYWYTKWEVCTFIRWRLYFLTEAYKWYVLESVMQMILSQTGIWLFQCETVLI